MSHRTKLNSVMLALAVMVFLNIFSATTIAETALTNAFKVQATLKKPLVLPLPKQIKYQRKKIVLVDNGKAQIELAVTEDVRDRYPVKLLNRAFRTMLADENFQFSTICLDAVQDHQAAILLGTFDQPKIKQILDSLQIDTDDLPGQGYIIDMVFQDGKPKIILAAKDYPGLIYAVSTFIQLTIKKNDKLTFFSAKVKDWPTISLRGPRCVGTSENIADWSAFYKMNTLIRGFDWDIPLSQHLKGIDRLCAERGIVLMIETHPGEPEKPFIFTNPENMKMLKARLQEAIDMEFSAVGIMLDDFPEEPQSEEDVKKYGPGLVGLGKAHVEMMKAVSEVTKGKITVYFCPRTYGNLYRSDIKPTKPSQEELEYRRLVGEIPKEIRFWTTAPELSYIKELSQLWGRKVHIYHNLFYSRLADYKLYFEPYPVPTPGLIDRVVGIAGGGASPYYDRQFRVNYMNLGANTWNPEAPATMKDCFIKEYGSKAAPTLLKYAIALGGHNKPGIPIMADVWGQPDEFAGVGISLHACGRLRKLRPDPKTIKKLRKKAKSCKKAMNIDWAKIPIPESEAELLSLNAERIYLNFSCLADIQEMKSLKRKGREKELAKLHPGAVKKGKRIREIIETLKVERQAANDWKILGQVPDVTSEK